ncbi:MAG: DUF1365 family protein, partial [Proteobacteria bacterium]|nr:DUF1365 family protein [Pseudomonadota bacterium]
VDLAGARVLLLRYPRLFGCVFNPLSVYYCYDRSGQIAALIYEVRDTFGEMHAYVPGAARRRIAVGHSPGAGEDFPRVALYCVVNALPFPSVAAE